MGTSPDDSVESGAQDVSRESARDSTFLSAKITFDSTPEAPMDVRVRNVSAGGMMIDISVAREKGVGLTVELKNVGKVRGQVAWSTNSRMGIDFDAEIDPALARHKPTAPPVPGYKRPYTESRRPGLATR